MSSFGRGVASDLNEMNRSLGALVGIAQGLVCDGQLNDQEIGFLNGWLERNAAISSTWPGDLIHARIRGALADGRVTDQERAHLINTLEELVGASHDSRGACDHVTRLGFDQVATIHFADKHFCLTGEFVYGPREACESAISKRGGVISSVTKKLEYLVVGSRGSNEWRHGSFGTKFEKAMQYKRSGCPILIVTEHCWAGSL
jgi:hypothetical protein